VPSAVRTGLYSGASWEQIGNSIGNVSPMRPQCENTKVATCEPWIRRLQAPPQRVPNTTSMAEVPDSKSGSSASSLIPYLWLA
jgi:hypothetical protein